MNRGGETHTRILQSPVCQNNLRKLCETLPPRPVRTLAWHVVPCLHYLAIMQSLVNNYLYPRPRHALHFMSPPPPTTLQLHKSSSNKTAYGALLILKQQLVENFFLSLFFFSRGIIFHGLQTMRLWSDIAQNNWKSITSYIKGYQFCQLGSDLMLHSVSNNPISITLYAITLSDLRRQVED